MELNSKMSWKKVLIIAVISAVITAVLNCIPALKGTSFTAPAETLEIWIVIALFIILNCKGYKEAMAKTFVFFLVSQPLIYLIEVPFKAARWDLFSYYPYWALATVLTLPGAAIAYRVKKGDLLSALILSVAGGIMIFTGFSWLKSFLDSPPHHLIAAVFCLIGPFVMAIMLMKEKKSKIAAIILMLVIFGVGLFTQVLVQDDTIQSFPIDEGNWTVASVSDEGLNVEVQGESMVLTTHTKGTYTVVFVRDDGLEKTFEVTVSGANLRVDVEEVDG